MLKNYDFNGRPKGYVKNIICDNTVKPLYTGNPSETDPV